jgi:hypothetical protein
MEYQMKKLDSLQAQVIVVEIEHGWEKNEDTPFKTEISGENR